MSHLPIAGQVHTVSSFTPTPGLPDNSSWEFATSICLGEVWLSLIVGSCALLVMLFQHNLLNSKSYWTLALNHVRAA
jgi:hypothetical protein